MLLIVCVVLVCCGLTLTYADKHNCRKGVIWPVDPYFLQGQDLVLICRRNNNVKTPHLYFRRGGEVVEQKHITKLNESAIELRIPNITTEDVERHYYRMNYECFNKRSKKGIPDSCINNQYVTLDYYPHAAKNLQCIVYNWDTMNCSWELEVQYKHPEDYDISCWYVGYSELTNNESIAKLQYVLSEDASQWAYCPESTAKTCFWNSSIFTDAGMYIIEVNVTNTRLNITTSRNKTFVTEDIVKPAPVSVSAITVKLQDAPSHVEIQWRHSKAFFEFLYNVTVSSDCDSRKVFEIPHSPDLKLSVPAHLEMTDLKPNTVYVVTISAKPLNSTGHWSDPSSKTFKTKPAVPRTSPRSRIGLFEGIQNGCISEKENCRQVKIYFKPLEKCEKFSDTTQYLITTPLMEKRVIVTTFSAVVEVPGNQSSVIQLRSFSEEGTSSNYTSVPVYPESQWPNRYDLVVEYNRKTGDCNAGIVVLKEDTLFTSISHTIVWCLGRGTCEEAVHSYVMQPNQTHFKLPLKHCQNNQRVGLTISGQRDDTMEIITSGIFWVPCKYEQGKVPLVPLQDIQISKSGSPKSFKVTWTPYTCETENINYVEHYIVSYCQVSESENCTCEEDLVIRNVSKLNTSLSVSLDRKPAGTQFCVWVRAKTKGGLGPVNDESRVFTVGDDEENNMTAVIGMIVPPVVVILLILGFIYAYKRCKQFMQPLPVNDIVKSQSDADKAEQIQLSTVEETEPFISHDSGTSSLSSNEADSDGLSDERSQKSHDSGIPRADAEDSKRLFNILDEESSGSYTYNNPPDEFDEYDFSAITSTQVSVETTEEKSVVDDECIYSEINEDNFSRSIDGNMYLHPPNVSSPSNVSIDAIDATHSSRDLPSHMTEHESIDNTCIQCDNQNTCTQCDKCEHNSSSNEQCASHQEMSTESNLSINESVADGESVTLSEPLQTSSDTGKVELSPNPCEMNHPREDQIFNADSDMSMGYKRPCDLLIESSGSDFLDEYNSDISGSDCNVDGDITSDFTSVDNKETSALLQAVNNAEIPEERSNETESSKEQEICQKYPISEPLHIPQQMSQEPKNIHAQSTPCEKSRTDYSKMTMTASGNQRISTK